MIFPHLKKTIRDNSDPCRKISAREGGAMTYNSETGRDERIIIHVDADFKTLLPGFLKDWEEEARTMREALGKNNYEAIRKIGHDMKGIGGSCGLEGITDMGSSLAESAKSMDKALIVKILDTISDFLVRVEFVYVFSFI